MENSDDKMTGKNTNPATIWGKGNYATIGGKLNIVAEELCESMDLRGGSHLLDLACGHGNAALAAARRECKVSAVDTEDSLLALGRQRAALDGLDVEFQHGSILELPYQDHQFDSLCSTFGVQFAPEPTAVAKEMIRVAKDGATIGLANWKLEGFGQKFAAVLGKYSQQKPPFSPYDWAVPTKLAEFFGPQVSWQQENTKTFHYRFAKPEDWFSCFVDTYGPIMALNASLDAEGQASLAADMNQCVAEHNIADDGSLVLPVTYMESVGTVSQ